MTAARDYWLHCGYALLQKQESNQLVVTDDFVRHLMARPELAPVAQSCDDEVALHRELLEQPRAAVDPQRLARLRDPDARENYSVWLRFRERLLAYPTLEASYLSLFRGQGVDVPPVFVHQLTQVLLRHTLAGEATAMQARAAEMLYRTQRIALQDGAVMAADEEVVERYAVSGGFGSVGELLQRGGAPLRSAELDVLREQDAPTYWERDEAHDLAISLNHGEPALAALCDVLEGWVRHFLGARVHISVEREIEDHLWLWHVGLDAQASAVLNDLYQGFEVSEERMARMLCLFRLDFEDPALMRREIAGHPVYLAMAMASDQRLTLKPQNLLVNLPLARQC